MTNDNVNAEATKEHQLRRPDDKDDWESDEEKKQEDFIAAGNADAAAVAAAKLEVEETLHTRQWLFHMVEVDLVDGAVIPIQKYLSEEDKNDHDNDAIKGLHQQAIDAIVSSNGNSLKQGDVGVHVYVLDKEEEPFDFNSVHLLKLPPKEIMMKYPMVVMPVYHKCHPNKMFLKVKAALPSYDGVTAFHTLMNVLEYLETQGEHFSDYPFLHQTLNPDKLIPSNRFDNFLAQIKRIEDAKLATKEDPEYLEGKWKHTPYMYEFEDKFENRPGLRITNIKDDVTFKDILKKIDEARDAYGDITHVALTLNFSPMTALSICPSMEGATNKTMKFDHVTFPPEGVGAPQPMNNGHVEALFNTVFLNNYGKHPVEHCQKYQIVGHLWDWAATMKTFPPFFFVATIQNKLFFSCSAPPPDMPVLEKIFNSSDKPIGTCHAFVNRPYEAIEQCLFDE